MKRDTIIWEHILLQKGPENSIEAFTFIIESILCTFGTNPNIQRE